MREIKIIMFSVLAALTVSFYGQTVNRQTDKNNAMTEVKPRDNPPPIAPAATPTAVIEPVRITGKRVKLSEMPVEIRVALAPDYNYQEKPNGKGFRWKPESPEWAKEYNFEVADRDLDHDGINEKLLIYLLNTVRGDEPFSLHIFKRENGRWRNISPQTTNISADFEIIPSNNGNEFDFLKVDVEKYYQYWQMKNGRYEILECRKADQELVECVH